jgi:hypothetical protein
MQISRGIAGLHSVNGIPGKTRDCGSLPTVRVGFHETRGGSLGKLVTTQSYTLAHPSHLKPPFSSLPAYLQLKYRLKMQQPQQIPQGWEARW